MIPREILKKIRQIELRTNRLVTASLSAAVYKSQRDSVPKPRVARNELPWVIAPPASSTARRLWPSVFVRRVGICHNPVGVDEDLIPFTQGSSCVATLGWRRNPFGIARSLKANPNVSARRPFTHHLQHHAYP